jgi:hypothetical protein
MKKILFIFAVSLVIACKKQTVSTEEVIHSLDLSPAAIDADGSSLVNVSVRINKDAELSKRKVVFETSAGTFTTNNTKTVTIDALYEGGELFAKAVIKGPISPGTIEVTARPENRNPYNDFIIKKSVDAVPSLPASVTVASSAFGVQTGYVSEVLITGTLRNQKNKNVSTGVKVRFDDIYQNGTPVGGRFRQIQSSSDENSKVSAYYSPGLLAPGTDLLVRVTVLDAAGNPTPMNSAVVITVIP